MGPAAGRQLRPAFSFVIEESTCMKATITYLLLNTARGSLTHIPHAVCGDSGKTYGHALFSKEHGTHVFEMDQATYENGAGLDLVKNAHRSLQKWEVRCKVVAELDEQETELANELENSKGEVARWKLVANQLTEEVETLKSLLSKQPTPLPVINMRQETPDSPATQAAPPVNHPTPSRELTAANANDWTYQELRDLARDRMLEFNGNPSRVKLLDMLLPK